MKIIRPTFLLNEDICKANIKKMADKAQTHNLQFRPHFKTHQSATIGEWFKQHGINKITVSSVSMAEYFVDAGWNDITIAFPVNITEIEAINELAGKVSLNLLAESVETVDFLLSNLEADTGLFIKIDTGYHRTGIDPSNTELIDQITNKLIAGSRLIFKGFLCHNGHTYKVKNSFGIFDIHMQSVYLLKKLKERYLPMFPNHIISIGDTPSCSIAEYFEGVDEIRPGNFVFYDIMQYELGACRSAEIAVAIACPVVAIHNDRKEIVIYGGAVHLSKDYITEANGNKIFGYVCELTENGWSMPIPNTYVASLSQEHGIIRTTSERIDKFRTGMIVAILPVHSCLTANLMRSYMNLSGSIIETMNSLPGGKGLTD